MGDKPTLAMVGKVTWQNLPDCCFTYFTSQKHESAGFTKYKKKQERLKPNDETNSMLPMTQTVPHQVYEYAVGGTGGMWKILARRS